MELDLGARQTGKTTRLIDSVIQFLESNTNRSAVIVTNNTSSRRLIMDKVVDRCWECQHRLIGSHRMLPGLNPDNSKHFIDELGVMKREHVFIDKNAYYNTSSYNGYSDLWGWDMIDDLRDIVYIELFKPVKVLYKHGLT